jgi:hypothetical protein
MTTTAVHSSRQQSRSTTPKLSRKEAAKKIIALIECDMTKKEMTEVEKNRATKNFAQAIDHSIAARRKS